MNTDAIELICEKLGTTIENLVPAVISYLHHSNKIGIVIGIILAAIGAILICAGIIIEKHGDGINYLIQGVIIFLIGSGIAGCSIYCQHMVTAYPQISAYKEIFGWLRS